MPLPALLRAVSVLAVIVFAVLVPNHATEREVIFSLGFAPYFLSLVYAQKPLARVVNQPATLLASMGLVIASAALSGTALLVEGEPQERGSEMTRGRAVEEVGITRS